MTTGGCRRETCTRETSPCFWHFVTIKEEKSAVFFIYRSSDMVSEAVLLGEGILCLDDAQQHQYRCSTWVLQQQPITAARVRLQRRR